MDIALVGLLGVVLGSAGSLIGARMSIRSAERLAHGAHREKRTQDVREKGTLAYTAAIEATAWLSTSHVEDSVDPRWEDAYRPRTEAAVERLREARRATSAIASSGVSEALSTLASEIEVALGVLDDSWHNTQEYAKKLAESDKGSKFENFWKKPFDDAWKRLISSREQLTGFDDSLLVSEEVEHGGAMPDSLLHRFRQAVASLD